jgi:hypothetical protein
MFLSESMMRAIHADRMREIERTGRDRRLVASAAEAKATEVGERAGRPSGVETPTATRPGRTGMPA